MNVEDAINERLSTREFSNKSVKYDAILEAIDAANHAPFAGNVNNLKFIITETKESKQVLSEFSQQFWINDSAWTIIVCSEPEKLENLYQDKGLDYSKQQVGAAIQNFLLRITDLGLAACWIGAFSEYEIKTHFKIPEDWSIEAIIPVGYAKSKTKKQTRKAPLEGKIFWEVWDQKTKPRIYPHKDSDEMHLPHDNIRDEPKRKK